jgi:predicted aspartyl protease
VKRAFNFNTSEPLPLVFAKIKGKLRKRPVRLVFDTGAFMTQLTTSVIEELGYSARDGLRRISAYGPSGPIDEGYAVAVEHLELFGNRFNDLVIAAYDFSNLESEGIDGLLGFDVIKQLHIEMNGPKGELIIY